METTSPRTVFSICAWLMSNEMPPGPSGASSSACIGRCNMTSLPAAWQASASVTANSVCGRIAHATGPGSSAARRSSAKVLPRSSMMIAMTGGAADAACAAAGAAASSTHNSHTGAPRISVAAGERQSLENVERLVELEILLRQLVLGREVGGRLRRRCVVGKMPLKIGLSQGLGSGRRSQLELGDHDVWLDAFGLNGMTRGRVVQRGGELERATFGQRNHGLHRALA